MRTEIALVSPERSLDAHAPRAVPKGRLPSTLRRLSAALRFDGLWWRKFARLGSVYGPEWGFLSKTTPMSTVFALGSAIVVYPQGKLLGG